MELLAKLVLSGTLIFFGVKVYQYFRKNKASDSDITSVSGIGSGLILVFAGLLLLLDAFGLI
ncbi:MAG: hypothetical protein ED555_03225 [Allomuricauda sp.]|nr:MAG: hypothetical protein ED555_03225 [Allomuricauda sp.]